MWYYSMVMEHAGKINVLKNTHTHTHIEAKQMQPHASTKIRDI